MSISDVVVIGNSALGLASARALVEQDPNCRVAVIGPNARPRAASLAAGAMLGAFGEIVAPLLKTEIGRAKIAESMQVRSMWDEWVAGLNEFLPADSQLKIQRGTFVFNNAKSGYIEDRNYEAIRKVLADNREPFEVIDPTSIPGMQPAADCRPQHAMFLPNEGSVNSAQLIAALTNYCEKHERITLIDDFVDEVIRSDSRVRGVRTRGNQTIDTSRVVLAAGIASQDVLDGIPELAARIPRVFAGGGCSMVFEVDTELPTGVVRTPNRAFACGLHVVPYDNHLYVGATNHITARPFEKVNVSDMYFLTECLMDQIHQDHQSARLVEARAGNRPVPIDGCPLVGPTSLEGLWIMTGTYRDGLFLSPLLAKDMARRMAGESPLYDNKFLPERKPIQTRTREEAVEETIEHYEAVGWEHCISIPRVGWHNAYRRMYGDMVNRIYDEIGSENLIPPEFVPMVDSDRDRWVPYFRDYWKQVEQAWS